MSELPIISPEDGTPVRLLDSQHDLVTSGTFATYMAGGWGSGKSLALVVWLAKMAMANPPGTRGMVVMPTFDMMDRFVHNSLLPSFKYLIRGHKLSKRTIYLPNGRELLYRSGHKPERVEMDNLCYVGLDEAGLMDRLIFTKAAARVRDKRAQPTKKYPGAGIALGLTGVPIYGWLKQEFGDKQSDKRRIIHARTNDNNHLHPDYAENLREICPASQIDMYLKGEFVAPGSQIWPEFCEGKHRVDWEYSPTVRRVDGSTTMAETVAIMDWSPRHPKVLFAQVVPAGVMVGATLTQKPVLVFFDELEPDGYEPNDPVSVIALGQMVRHRGYQLTEAFGDVAGNAVEQTSMQSAVEQMERMLGDLRVQFMPPHMRGVLGGIACVRLALSPLVGHPRIFVASNMWDNKHPRGLVNGIRGYTFKKDKDGNPSDDPRSDNLTEDPADCLRIGVVCKLPSEELMARHYPGTELHANIRR